MIKRRTALRKRHKARIGRRRTKATHKRGSLMRVKRRRIRLRLRRRFAGLPSVSVVMPSYNQATYIKEAIESVLGQTYPRLELIVVDGGSTDGTVEILKRYRTNHPTRFRYVSEPDRGQTHALNKGLSMAKGDVLGWLNSDDRYHKGAVLKAAAALRKHPDWALVYGNANYINESGTVLYPYPTKPFDRDLLVEECFICQPSAFLRKDAVVKAGGWDESLRFCMDYDLWVRLSKQHSAGYIAEWMADSRLHEESKTMLIWKDVGLLEVFRMSWNHYGAIANRWLAEYAHHHWTKGVFWLMKQYTAYDVFGPMPNIAATNRYQDGWFSDDAQLQIEGSVAQVHTVLMSGRHSLPDLYGQLHITAFVNGCPVQSYEAPANSFLLEIPVHSSLPIVIVDIHTEEGFCPANFHLSSDQRELGFVAEEILALNSRAYDFYRAYQQSPHTIPLWFGNS